MNGSQLNSAFYLGYESFKRINDGQAFEYSKLLLHPECVTLRSTKYSTRLLSTGPNRSEIYTRQKTALRSDARWKQRKTSILFCNACSTRTRVSRKTAIAYQARSISIPTQYAWKLGAAFLDF